ncbi:NADH-ubiquinone oxidoreductase-F iron-sulfur binding region domain-containing protein [Candidatus Solincola sp.]|nr:NADH-ubiquinone oxidoreductase-F iron-sulfur binding region domain-containing protein [Actinomycetota bacterium]MDI7251993.1 NADH-ubiquinone oxidoreductase-F iron-sulfur binding region domain-containing protein [Actinomycetota bacterium]
MNVPPQPGLASAVVSVVREKGYLSGQDMETIARSLRIPTSRVYGFCSQFPELTRPPGRPLLQLCSGPACAAVEPEAETERALAKLGMRAEVFRVPGLARPHRSPALTARLPGEGERLIEGFRVSELEELTMILDRRDLSAYPLPEEERFPGAVEVPEGEISPWLASLSGKGLSRPPDTGSLKEVSRDPTSVREFLEEECGFSSPLARAGPPALLVCDAVGPSSEGSVDLLVSRSCPEVVAAGAVLAAAALGARKVIFFLPWDLEELEARLRLAAAEAASEAGLEWEVLPGPLSIPCRRDIGVAAFLQGMMLWRAASICGRDGPLRLDPPTLVCGAVALWKLPWVLEQEGGGEKWKERRTLIAVSPDGASRWLEPPPSLSASDLEGLLKGVPGERPPRAFYLEGMDNRIYPSGVERVEIPGGTRRLLVLDESTCMAGWAQRMLATAEGECCGGCTPGRTAPTAAAAVLASIVEGGTGEEGRRGMADLLERAELLALCPQLLRTFPVIRACMEFFPEDFGLRSGGGDETEGTVSGSGKAYGMGVRG